MAANTRAEVRWRALIREQESSGESVWAFAQRRGLSAATLYWWRSRLRRRSARPGVRLQLAPVTIVPSESRPRPSTASSFDLELASGRRLRVPADFDANALRRLVATLERGC
jgi:hypothetical protein